MAQPEDPLDDPFGALGADVPWTRPRLRPDLRIVYENDASSGKRSGERGGKKAVGGEPRVRLVDPATGRNYSFSAQEYLLCSAADGRTGLREIRAKLEAAGETPAPEEIVAFFRRLHIMGLLAAPGKDAAIEPVIRGPASPAELGGGESAAPPRRRSRLRTAPAGTPGGAEPAGGALRAGTPAEAPLTAEASTGNASTDVVPSETKPTVQGAPEAIQLGVPPDKAAVRRRAARLGAGLTRVQPAEPEPGPAHATVHEAGRDPVRHGEPRPAGVAEAKRDLPVAPRGVTASDDPLDIVAGRLAPPETDDTEDKDDDFGLTGAFGGMGMGAGMGMGLGGMGAGMGMGGMGVGMGMGAGMAGGPNRERIMAALAARRGIAGMVPEAGDAVPDERARPASLTLFDPTWLLRLLHVLFYPAKYLMWLVVPLVVLAGMTAAQNWHDLVADHMKIARHYAAITLLIIGFLTGNLASRLAQGVAIVAHGGKVQSFGIMLVLGVVPRFFVDITGVAALDRRGQLWAYAAPILARLALFAGGMLTWAIARENGVWLPLYTLIVAQFGLVMFVFSAFPLLPGDGQRWLSVYLDEPRLVPKAGAALRHLLTGAPLPPLMDRRDIWPLALFALGTIISLAAVVLAVGLQLAIWFEAEMAGTGVSLFLLLVAAFLTWLVILRITIGRRMGRFRDRFGGTMGGGAMGAGLAQEPVDPMLGRVVDPQRRRATAIQTAAMAAPAPVSPAVAEQAPSAAPRVVWGMILVGLLAVAFLPYSYEAGGSVEILPAARAQAVARTSGEVVEILVSEGDLVTRGQLLARLSSWDQENDVRVTQAMLEGAEANLARLEAGAKPEALELAMRELDRARASLAFSEAEANRARELVATGTISQQAYEEAVAAYESDLAGLEVSQANLDLVRSGATTEEIAIATAEVARLTEELAFRQDELTRTRIEAPMDGRVITADLELRHGAFLTVGETLVEIEDTGTITAMIAVPEADIALITPGDAVRLRIWGQSGSEIPGTVRDIAPVASGTTQGNVVQVEASFANAEGLLRSGMTGYAKVEGAEMRVWEAYLRSIRRFVEIEVWSWIP